MSERGPDYIDLDELRERMALVEVSLHRAERALRMMTWHIGAYWFALMIIVLIMISAFS